MSTHIINPEFVLRGVLEHTIIYGDGDHSRDLQSRGLLPKGTTENMAHHVILPIELTESAVLELLKSGISQEGIISWSGVMAKAPNGTPSVHALWGPAAQTKLKIAVAMETFGPGNQLMRNLLGKMTSNGIKIVETNKPEHDSKMAVIQGLINLWLVMVGDIENSDLQTQLIQHWKTPIGTIVDMIHANPFAEILIKRFFEGLNQHKYNLSAGLEEAVNANLTEADIEKFGTPNSERVLKFISGNNGGIIVSESSIRDMQQKLNSIGHTFLAEKIKRIRKQQ